MAGEKQNQEAGDVLRGVLQDDADAWRRLVDEYAGFMLAIARKTFGVYGADGRPHDVEDVVAEVWRNLLEKDRKILRQCLERGGFLQTVYVLTRNRTVDFLRKHRTNQVPFEEAAFEIEALPAEPSDALSPDHLPLEQALDKLTPRERTLVRLFYLQRKKYRDIAVVTGLPQNSIGPTLGRALAKLRKAIVRPGAALAARGAEGQRLCEG